MGIMEVVARRKGVRLSVSIQLGSPASGDTGALRYKGRPSLNVSIQLGSPASGDPLEETEPLEEMESFHSIRIPSKWG